MPQAHATSRPDARRYERHLPADRRRALIEAALRSLARSGAEGLSIRAIAAEAGVSVGLINHHFPSRIALIAEAYRHLHGRLAQSLESAVAGAPADPMARLSAYLRASLSPPFLDADTLHIWIVFWGLSRATPEIRAVREETYAASLAVLEGLIGDVHPGAAVDSGRPCGARLRRDPPDDTGGAERQIGARLLAIGLTALLDGLWLEWCLNPATFRPEEGIALAEGWVEGMTGRMVSGTFAGGPRLQPWRRGKGA